MVLKVGSECGFWGRSILHILRKMASVAVLGDNYWDVVWISE